MRVGRISWLHRRSSLSCRGAFGVCRGGIYLLGLSDTGRPILAQGWIFFNESSMTHAIFLSRRGNVVPWLRSDAVLSRGENIAVV